MVKCPLLPEPPRNEEGNYENTKLDSLMKFTKELQVQYNECAIRHDSSVNLMNTLNVKIKEINDKIQQYLKTIGK